MSKYRVTPRALSDLDSIADHTLARWGERQTEKYLSAMMARFKWLGENPAAGRVRDEVGKGYRSYRQGSHLIFYVIDGGIVVIIGIPHGAMDIDAFFQSPG